MSEIEKIVKRYSEKLRENNFRFSAIYLFGSQTKGKAGQWSEIDVAVVADTGVLTDEKRLMSWKIRRIVDLRIEPHVFTKKDFNSKSNIFAEDIRKTGIRIE